MKRPCVTMFLMLLLPAAVFGQANPELCNVYKDQIGAIQKQPKGKSRDAAISDILKPAQHAGCIAIVIAGNTLQGRFKRAFEAARTDKQEGAGVGAGGGTNLISKGVAAQALSLASEYGALTESTSGQVETVSGSLDGVPGALIRGGLAMYCIDGLPPVVQKGCISKSAINLLKRLSYSVSFDTSRESTTLTGAPASPSSSTGPTTPVTFSPSGREISSIGGRFEIWNQRDTTSADYAKAWMTKLQDKAAGAAQLSAANALLAAFETLFASDFVQSSDYQKWYAQAIGALEDATDVEAAWRTLFAQLVVLAKKTKEAQTAAADFLTALSRYELEQDLLITEAATKSVWSFEYADNRPVGQDSNSTFRMIFDKGIGKKWALTANAAVSVWDNAQSKVSVPVNRLRDAQAGAEIDYKLGKIGSLISAATVSGSYYFQHQDSAILLNVSPAQPLPGITFSDLPSGASSVLADTGTIHIAQLKLTIGTGSNLRVPLAISYSNRSELVPKPSWKAQVGLSYDFDSLFSK